MVTQINAINPPRSLLRKQYQPDEYDADVCLLLEGTYPYVTGGVSNWVHDVIGMQSDKTFALFCITTEDQVKNIRYEMPDNIVSLTIVSIQTIRAGAKRFRKQRHLCRELEKPLVNLLERGSAADLMSIIHSIAPFKAQVGSNSLLNSLPAWELVTSMYSHSYDDLSFIDFFWSWRTLLTGLYAGLLAPLPRAKVYHALSTGYAGLAAARAKIETGRPVMLTEHGLYTNERRIELAMADWLHDTSAPTLELGKRHNDLRNVWINAFSAYALACYETCDEIITLHEVNKVMQLHDGAPADRLSVIPNGVDIDFYGKLKPPRRPRRTVAFIGRVVPIKDVATFIQACNFVIKQVPDAEFLVMGPTEEDKEYFARMQSLVEQFGLTNNLKFLGNVKLSEYLPKTDVIVLTSISESQPLVILEGGAAAIPVVTTNVGACWEMLNGRSDERPLLPPGGYVTPVANAQATAKGIIQLLTDEASYNSCSEAMQKRIQTYYRKSDVDAAYRELYTRLSEKPTTPFQLSNEAEEEVWPELASA